MALPDVHLDDRDFQSLVTEARKRIAETCPEWTDHNVSDPGITLIEQFAWMTELLLYRVNRIPEKVHLELLQLLGVQLRPPEAATAQVVFRLGAPAETGVLIEGGVTQVASSPEPPLEPAVFVAAEDVTIPALRLEAVVISRDGAARDVPVDDGVAFPSRRLRSVLGDRARFEEAVLLGFRESLANLVVVVDVEATVAGGPGIRPERPPWVWEVSRADRRWSPVDVIRDETGGLNYGSGRVELQLPADAVEMPVGGRTLSWLRCRLRATPPASRDASGYTRVPAIERIQAGAIGARVPMEHAAVQEQEMLGHSDGTPGQSFHVRHTPALPLRPDEVVKVWDHDHQTWTPWERRESFENSGRDDRHFTFDPVSGRIDLGPAVRVPGGWHQFGAVPPEGAGVCISRYRYGDGAGGNVAAGALTVVRTPVPGVVSVTNVAPACNGAPAESMEEARTRASGQLATRHRAVTAADVEHLAAEASRQVARVRCGPSEPGEAVPVRILPAVDGDTARLLELDELRPSDALLAHVASRLDAGRVLGTSLQVTPVPIRGVTVAVKVRLAAHADEAAVQQAVDRALYAYLNPLTGGDDGTGWPFGRPLTMADLEVRVRRIAGVAAIDVLRIYETDLDTSLVAQHPVDGVLTPAPDELIASGAHAVRVVRADEERAA